MPTPPFPASGIASTANGGCPVLGSPELAEIMRPAREPLQQVDDTRVHALLMADPKAYLDWLTQDLHALAAGEMELVLPPKALFEDGPGRGDFRVMPCVTRRGGRVVKTVKVVGTNLAQLLVPDQVTVGKAMRLHPEENYVTHLFDACALSSIRTGACAALAIRLLALRRRRIRIVGAGRVGFYGAVFACALGGIEALHLDDAAPGRAAAAARLLAGLHPNIEFSSGTEAPGPVDDVLMLATTSAVPLCSPPARGASLIVSVGADSDYQCELDEAWAGAAEIVVDTPDSARIGDLRRWVEEGRIQPAELRDLCAVLRGWRKTCDKPTLFVSTGSALFDNLTIAYLAERLDVDGHSSETKSSSL